MSNRKPLGSQSEKGKVYRLKLDSESKLLAAEAKRDSLRPPPMPHGIAMTEIEKASDTLEQAVSDQTQAVYLVVSKLDSTSQRQEAINRRLNFAIVALVILTVMVMTLCLIFLSSPMPS